MNPVKSTKVIPIKDFTIHDKFETLAYKLIGSGTQLEQLGQLCIILVIAYILKNLINVGLFTNTTNYEKRLYK